MPKKSAAVKTYNELSEELRDILNKLESGELDIDQSVATYARGLEIISDLEARLKQSEHTVATLHAAHDESSAA